MSTCEGVIHFFVQQKTVRESESAVDVILRQIKIK